MNKNVAIVHYNTPELTEAAILSLRKHGGEKYSVYVLDNSDARPFKTMEGVLVFDNTKGQIIDFNAELEKYPDRDEKIGCAKNNTFASEKHMMSVQKLWELIPDGFILMESDILIKQSIDFMFMWDECVCGHINRSYGPPKIERLAPMLCWINVPMCVAGGARYFDPDRAYALHKGKQDPRNYWDTGAALLDDIRRLKPQCHGRKIDINPLVIHYGSASWIHNDLNNQLQWLEEHKSLWSTEITETNNQSNSHPSSLIPHPKYSVLTYIFDGYETVHEIEEKDPEAEYILVTDNPRLQSKTWRIYYDGSLIGKSGFDKTFEVRYNPFRYVTTETVIRIDGSIRIKASLKPIYEEFIRQQCDRCLMIHPLRNTIRSEYDIWVKKRQYPQKMAAAAIDFIKATGYDVDAPKGLYQANFEIVKHTWHNQLFNDMVLNFVRLLGEPGKVDRLDQTISSFVLNHYFEGKISVMPVSEKLVTESQYLQWCIHNSNKAIKNTQDKIPPILFGHPCTPWEPK